MWSHEVGFTTPGKHPAYISVIVTNYNILMGPLTKVCMYLNSCSNAISDPNVIGCYNPLNRLK